MRKYKFGFTIVELLVVITIIGLLMALLLPAVGRVRDNARRIQCVNQLKQLGTASLNFHSQKEYFPGYISEMRTNDPSGQTRIVSWFTQLLPMMERNDWYDAIQQGVDGGMGTFDSTTYSELAVCPSNEPDTKDLPHLSYVINMGVWDPAVETTVAQGEGKKGRAWRDSKANGISHNLVGLLGRHTPLSASVQKQLKREASQVRVSTSYISSADGTPTTIMLTENVDAGFWFTPNYADQGQFGVVWMNPPTEQLRVNENRGLGSDVNIEPKFARPSSEHAGVVVVTFCDGHTDLLNEEIDPTVLARLMTPNGRECDVDRRPDAVSTPPYQLQPVSDTDYSN